VRLRHPAHGAVDLLLAETDYQREALRRAVLDRSTSPSVRVLAIEDVLVHKLIAGRPRDLADVEDILATDPPFDEAYVERWVAYWDVGDRWRRLREGRSG
jgi:hypothetical protein